MVAGAITETTHYLNFNLAYEVSALDGKARAVLDFTTGFSVDELSLPETAERSVQG